MFQYGCRWHPFHWTGTLIHGMVFPRPAAPTHLVFHLSSSSWQSKPLLHVIDTCACTLSQASSSSSASTCLKRIPRFPFYSERIPVQPRI